MITQISKLQPGRVEFYAMVDTIRDKKNMQFIVVKDFSSKIQLFIDKVKYPEIGEMFLRLVPGATVKVCGELVLSEYVKMGGREVLVDSAEVTSKAEPNPIADDSTIDYKLNYRWIDLRTEKNTLMFKVQTTFVNALREFLLEKDFVEIHSPKLIATASESGSEVFEVKYFDTKAYLAQSPQFYKQMAMAGGLGRIFECAPVFRAEKSHSRLVFFLDKIFKRGAFIRCDNLHINSPFLRSLRTRVGCFRFCQANGIPFCGGQNPRRLPT